MFDIESAGYGQLAKVAALTDANRRVYLELPTSGVGWATSSHAIDLKVGDIVLIGDNSLERAPAELWKSQSWVAVVKIKLADTTVVDSGGAQPTLVPTKNDVAYEVGNTVEVDRSGVIRILAEEPLRSFDLPEVDQSTILKFIPDPTSVTQGFEDFGGLQDIVKRARLLIETPLKYRKALDAIGARSIRGVLFTGDPGTGKTMLARIIAKESNVRFYLIKGPEIVSKWHGQTEDILRKIFAHAATNAEGAIIFFDEIDSIASQRDEDAHEASKRLVAQLLTLMDGFTKSNVVVIATTNRPQDIDVALLRPGRFDWEINFPLPDESGREEILRISSKEISTAGLLPYSNIAARTEGWSPAALTGIWTEAALLAASDGRSAISAEDYIAGYETVQQRFVGATKMAEGRQKRA
jgi:transitional endoplasmic reticulum ATPase